MCHLFEVAESVNNTHYHTNFRWIMPCLNTLRERQNCRHFTDVVFKQIPSYEYYCTSIHSWLTFLLSSSSIGSENGWHWAGNRPSSETMMPLLTNVYMCHSASMSLLIETQGLYSLSGKTSYCQISWSLEAARLDVMIIVSLWNLTDDYKKNESRGFETSRDLVIRRPPA